MSLVLNESQVLAKTRSQDLKSVIKLNCWGSGLKDVTLVRKLVNVEVIGLSCNEITTLEDFAYCTKLRELILRKNKIKDIAEVAHLTNLPNLTNLWLGENPCAENTHNYRKVVLKALPNLTCLDNIPVTKEELQEIEELGNEIYEEIPYESSISSGSGPTSAANHQQSIYEQPPGETTISASHQDISQSNNDQSIDQSMYFSQKDPHFSSTVNRPNSSFTQRMSHRGSMLHPAPTRNLSYQGSALNVSHQEASGQNNNIILTRGGKIRESNILSAILCLIKELDYAGCEVVETALHCRMEEADQ